VLADLTMNINFIGFAPHFFGARHCRWCISLVVRRISGRQIDIEEKNNRVEGLMTVKFDYCGRVAVLILRDDYPAVVLAALYGGIP
jgi:hypothetical protein